MKRLRARQSGFHGDAQRGGKGRGAPKLRLKNHAVHRVTLSGKLCGTFEKEQIMFYEEKIINGVLCWRGMRNGEWTPVTPERLTELLTEARNEITSLYEAEAGASL